MIVVSGILTDIVPSFSVTEDILLISIFGGLINALAISLCLFANATSGGTDFIAIFLSEKYGIDSWNYIFAGNVVILGIAGALFGWDKALYSIFSVHLHPGTACIVQAVSEADTDYRDQTTGGCLRSHCRDHESRCHADQGRGLLFQTGM